MQIKNRIILYILLFLFTFTLNLAADEFNISASEIIIDKDKNISSEFVEMENGALVYHVSCSPSIKPCVINKVEQGIGKKINEELKGKEYFIRKKSESLALDGQERMDYIFERVSGGSSEE